MPKSKYIPNKDLLYLLSCTAIVTLLLLSSLNLNSYLYRNKEVLGVKGDLGDELKFWQNLVNENPTYIDGWLEIAKIASEMGDINLVTEAIARAKIIDPNSQELLEVEKEIY